MTIVDRIEGEFAVCECDSGQRLIPLASLPSDVREGDVLEELGEGEWFINHFATESRREKARRRLQMLLHPRDEDLPKQEG